ncbi:3-phosphoserine/phosphohydroxythreonine transaminase [Geomicrobium sediminis]|uniref:Phosphoserine aminotransferase n=1 Tax=Geomicrobium sediminis TaxID=1347788 RepID=A0ABS2PG42_9BACL|nr:3-phosphoserine/phosphohydroxythreonine transaminase [Geomicrobium sediminis]MBM7633951.1 phosphoserine aminotransferase [Geomicrobium sediminis]
MPRERIHNFNAGPAALPESVLRVAQDELLNYKQTGMSIMEHSHRGNSYEQVHEEAKTLIKELMNIDDRYEVLFLQGGASHQFAMIPYNFLKRGTRANYVLTGSWSEKAKKEANYIGQTYSGASSKADHYTYIPAFDTIKTSKDDAYVHLTSNNTIYGTAWKDYEPLKEWNAPVFADMSSDIFSRPIPVDHFDLIYAGAQKNLGPSGVTVVIVKRDLVERFTEHAEQLPAIMRYQTHIEGNSLYNTPPTFAIYMMKTVLTWIKEQGGLEEMKRRNEQKAALLYHAIDESNGFYKGHSDNASRSLMNVTWMLPTEELTKQFLTEASEKLFSGLNGHRSVGGVRASIYNAVPMESCEVLQNFMDEFAKKHR